MRSFDLSGLALSEAPFSVIATNAFTKPVVDISSATPMRADGVIQLYRNLRREPITVTGKIRGDSEEATDNAIDQLTRKVYRLRGKASIGLGYASGKRHFYGTAQMSVSREASDISRATYGIQLTTDKVYALDEDGSIAFGEETAVTSQYATIGVINGGTYLASPEINIAIGTVPTGAATITFSIGNPETSEALTVTADVVDGDTITILCDKKKTFLGTDEIKTSGFYPEWLPDSGLLEYSDDLASRSIVITPTYVRKWL